MKKPSRTAFVSARPASANFDLSSIPAQNCAADLRAPQDCLTRTVAIFKAYDGSLNGLASGAATGPNFYFDHLDGAGFGPKHPL